MMSMILRAALPLLLAAGEPAAAQPSVPAISAPAQPELSAIDRVWSGQSERFALQVTDKLIVVAYYDANRQLTVASRSRDAAYWVYQKLDTWVGWDSHNYIAMAVDAEGQIHVSANMHRDPLVYYRTAIAGEVRSLTRQPTMVEERLERRMTYPIFLKLADGRLVYKYRDGGSGDGNEIYNVYDARARRWTHLLQTPLTDGEGQRNAYFVGPTPGPDGTFHLAWVWRETPMAETNHDLSYARSRDLVHWERSDGKPLRLPITLSTAEIVDPVPVEGGMINNNTVVGFDPAGRPMITYHKFDRAGDTQIYVTRREGAGWHTVQVSDWKGFRWDFRGGGSLDSRLFVKGAVPVGSDRVRVSVVRDGRPIDFTLDARSLRRISETPGSLLKDRLSGRIAVSPGMELSTVEDPGGSGIALAWATSPPHRDLPSEDIPAPTVLRLVMPAAVQPSGTRP